MLPRGCTGRLAALKMFGASPPAAPTPIVSARNVERSIGRAGDREGDRSLLRSRDATLATSGCRHIGTAVGPSGGAVARRGGPVPASASLGSSDGVEALC